MAKKKTDQIESEENKDTIETKTKAKKSSSKKTTKKKSTKTKSKDNSDEEKQEKKTTQKKSSTKAKAKTTKDNDEEKPKKKTTAKKSSTKAKAKTTKDNNEEKPKKKTTAKKSSTKAKAKTTKDNDEEKPKKKATAKKSSTKTKAKTTKDNDEEKPKKKTTAKKSSAKAKAKTTKDNDEKKPKKKATKKSTKKQTAPKKVAKADIVENTSFALVKHSDINKKHLSTPLIFIFVIIVLAIPLSIFMAETNTIEIPTISVSTKAMQILTIFPILIFVVLTLVFAKFIYQKSYSFSLKEQLTEEDNPAVGISLAGYLIGVSLAIIGSVSHIANDNLIVSLPSIMNNLIPGIAISLILLYVSQKVLDKLILYRFSIEKELATDRNLGTAAICCGGFIATGLILMNSFSSKIEQGVIEYALAIVSAFVVGQLIFVISGWIFTKTSRFNFHYEVETRDNVSAGILFGGFLVGVGLVIAASVSNIEWENPPLFVAEHKMNNSFSQNDINGKMIKLFQDNGCPLSPKANVLSEQPNEWIIKNPGYYIQYIIVSKGTSIEVYNNNLFLITLHKAITALIAGILAILLLLFMGLWASRLLFFRISITQEIEQKNPAVALIIICIYIATGLVIQTLLNI
ncbi:DUF350 domain-containing protein [Candidatus Uabimicrobium sp. HlEnr_7]|uniref:DUF350 domain-containing protein n=1 Tax=Candidatus Uabimicrobium helgolandensis TaxID=3095367 RepID=UPI0035587C98